MYENTTSLSPKLRDSSKNINFDVFKKLEESVFFFKNAKEIVVVDRYTGKLKHLSSEAKLKEWILEWWDDLFIFTPEDEKKEERIRKNILKSLIVHLILKNQFSFLFFRRDPFADKPSVMRDDHILRYTAPGFYMREYKPRFAVSEAKKKQIIDDYKRHFNGFDEFLKWCIACRFTVNRRTSYTYLRVNAGFGKSFFAGIFEDLGVGRKIRQEQLKPKTAGDLSPADLRNSFILIIDEFTHFAQELKDITHYMYLSAKYQLSEKVEVFAKVFLSAEKSTSFFGEAGVDAQIADRVSVVNLESEKKRLEDNELYKENTLLYFDVIKEYVYNFFNAEAKKYIAMGELKANKVANDVLDDYFNKHRVESDTIERIREKMVEYLRDYIAWQTDMYSGFQDRERNTVFEQLQDNVFVKNKDEVVVKEPVRMYEVLIKKAGEQFAKVAKFKQTALDEIFKTNFDKKKIHKCGGRSHRGFLINLSEIDKHKTVLVEVRDENNNIVQVDEIEVNANLKDDGVLYDEQGKELF